MWGSGFADVREQRSRRCRRNDLEVAGTTISTVLCEYSKGYMIHDCLCVCVVAKRVLLGCWDIEIRPMGWRSRGCAGLAISRVQG